MKLRTGNANVVRVCLFWVFLITFVGAIASPKTIPQFPIWPKIEYANDESLEKREIHKQAPNDKLFLWRVDGEYSTVYLLGSVHLLKKSSYPLAPLYEYVYKESNQLCIEYYDPENSRADLEPYIKLPNGQKLWNHISSKTYGWIVDFTIDNDLAKDFFDDYKPIFVEKYIFYTKAKAYGFLRACLKKRKHTALKPICASEGISS